MIDSTTALAGRAIPYQQPRGRAFGELDPTDPRNQIINDLAAGANAKARYEASFVLNKPGDMSRASGFMWLSTARRR